MYDSLKTIRYMGNKSKLLDFIVPEIENLTEEGDVVCDLMAGTCAVSYALKNRNILYTNDIQYYSYIISKAIILNNKSISSELARELIASNYEKNLKDNDFHFFQSNYSDTYFSSEQCKEIDSIRFAIEKIEDDDLKSLFLLALMGAMSSCESTVGHFAQYLNKDLQRLIPIRKMSVYETFLSKCNDYKGIVCSSYKNKAFNMDALEFLDDPNFDSVKCVYIDTPYTAEQYSRFYHILETICKYDNPKLENNKGLYRDDRYMSKFSQNSSVVEAFEQLIKKCSEKNKSIVLSYSDRGLISLKVLENIIRKYYMNCNLKLVNYNHSTQGKGNIKIEEAIFVATTRRIV